MAISNHRFASWEEALAFLRQKAFSTTDHIFRGHTTQSHRLQTTWSRYSRIPLDGWMSDVQNVLTTFRVGLINNGLAPFESADIQDWLEYGRHHGVPTPCLDFSYSPYVALYFALSNLNGSSSSNDDAVVYIMDTKRLATAWANYCCRPPAGKNNYTNFCKEFLSPGPSFFAGGFPANRLQFFPFPSKTNIRMQRQQGCLLYDTLNFAAMGLHDLEGFLDANVDDSVENATDGSPTERRVLYKVFLKNTWREPILSELEVVGMGGGYLYGNADGVAQDIKNAYFYTPKRLYLRDVNYTPPTL